MRRSLLLLSASGLAAGLAGQGTFVVPSKAINNQPGAVWYDNAPQSYPLWGTSSSSTNARVQYLYDVVDIPIAAGNLTAVDVRAPVGYSLLASTFQTTIDVSMGPNSPTQASRTFASNHGVATATVFSGALNMPAASNGPWPRPWQTIPFSQPAAYVASAGQSLVIDFQTTSSSSQRSWSVEGMRAEYGRSTSEHYQSNCLNSGGNRSGGWGWSPSGLVPGGSFYLSLSGYPQNTPSLAANALFFGLQGQGAQFGAFTTPFPITNLGLPAPAGCDWSIGILGGAGYAMTYRSLSSSAQLEFPSGFVFPNTPSIAGMNFYTQNIALDVDPVGGPSLFPSIAIQWLIGTGNTIPCARVSSISSTRPTTGSVSASEAAVLQFTY